MIQTVSVDKGTPNSQRILFALLTTLMLFAASLMAFAVTGAAHGVAALPTVAVPSEFSAPQGPTDQDALGQI